MASLRDRDGKIALVDNQDVERLLIDDEGSLTSGPGGDLGLVLPGDLDFAATVEDLYQSVPFATSATMSATTQVGVMVALTRLRITSAGIMLFNSAVVANDTNFWTVQLLRWRAGGSVVIATKNTKITGGAGEGIAQRQGWVFDAIAFDVNNQILEPGDGVDFLFTPGGAPTALNNGIATLRYEPL